MENESGEFMEGDEEPGRKSLRQRDYWYEVVGEKQAVYSRDKVKHIEKKSRS